MLVVLMRCCFHPFGVILWLALAGVLPRSEAEEAVVVNPSAILVREFHGWGVSLCWWAHVVGHFPEEVRSRYCEMIFDEHRGLGLNIVRYNIGGGENPAHDFIMFRARIEGFQPEPGKWDWTADDGQRKILMMAKEYGADTFEAFANSPPFWMTHSGSVTGNHEGRPNLKDEYVDPFADYLTEVVKVYKERAGIEFDTLTPLNEPISSWWKFGNRQEGCVVPHAQQDELLQRTAYFLRKKGLRTRVTGPEENAVNGSTRALNSYRTETRSLLAQVNTHTYHAGGREALRVAAERANKEVWVSEYGDGDATGMTMALAILADIREMHAAAWVYWQAVDNTGGWGLMKNPLKDYSTTEFSVNRKYYALANFSKFIRPGSMIVGVENAPAIASYDATRRRLVIVVVNDRETSRHLEFDLRRVRDVGPLTLPYQTSEGHQLARQAAIPIRHKRFEATVPARSVTTFILDAVL